MSNTNVNPYRPGSSYHAEFAEMKSKQIFTKSDIIKFAIESLKKTTEQASADINVLFSSREKSERGDCRGNFSCKGHLYFVEKLARKEGEEQKFRLRYRKVALEPHTREVKAKVKPIKVKAVKVKAKKVVKAKVAKKAKAVKVAKVDVIAPIAPAPVAEIVAPVAIVPEVIA